MTDKYISDFHDPFADIDGTKFNYLCSDKNFGQVFSVKKGKYEYEIRISPAGSRFCVHRRKPDDRG